MHYPVEQVMQKIFDDAAEKGRVDWTMEIHRVIR